MDKIGKLEAENARLRAEGEKKSTGDDKLQTILERLDNLPTTVQVVTQAQASSAGMTEPDTDKKVPIYIPAMPDARSIPGRIVPKVTRSDGVEVEKAGKALRQFRNKGG